MHPVCRNNLLILVVDDDYDIRESLRVLLGSVGYRVSTAENALQAITEIGAQSPDLILTDIYMADGDGFELLNALRDFPENIPVIAMSGGDFGVSDYLGFARRLGAAATIVKPFRSAQVIEAVDRTLAA